ncbi:MAG: hypothetical protein KZQ88_00885 [Candidatus Thiodiazotropha sp. (ex Dulcina madagascariensis)]|nr:hypothetical protein [Candidatus Thiodiazotropha sp. (ex Dulcina madagascariensis)]MCU7927671.1 hypothetical protein [Candidatus Thiodiazotropha sp. (ex Dulcina madagascariensis)]
MRSGLASGLLLTLSLALPISATAEIRAGEPQQLRDLHYGEALFQLYQQNYFQAIVRLLSARKQGLMQAYEDEPELLLGGLYLAYGMPDRAETLFNRVLKQTATREVQNRAWLQLGKSRHRRGDMQAAKSALGRVGEDLALEASDEKHHLTGLIDLIQNDETQAISDLGKISGKSEWSLYGRFNQAIAHLRSNQQAEGLTLLQEIGSAAAENDNQETKAIRDRANLIRGFLLLETQQAEPAMLSLRRVRLDSPASNQALLGLGWALLQLAEREQALVPWQLLAERNASDPAVLEAKLAIPYVFSLLEANHQSLEAYRNAIETYENGIRQLERMSREIEQGDFPDRLIGEEDPTAAASELRSLLPFLLTGNTFQERLQDYRDLLSLRRNLQQWQEKTASYRTMLANQLAAYQRKLPSVEAYLQGDSLKQLTGERDRLQKRYQRAVSTEEPPFILATQEERGWIERLKRIERLIDGSGAGEQLTVQGEIARLMEGILTWRTVTEHPGRVWTLKKQMRELEQNLETARHQERELAEARHSAEDRFKAFSNHIRQLEADIPQLLKQVEALRLEEAGLLQEMAIDRLEKRRGLINNYLVQARFGIANLLDLSSGREGAPE